MNNGLTNEKNIILMLNGKSLLDLNDNLKSFIIFLFKDVNENDLIISGKINGKQKADIFIKINYNIKYISIKSGSENSIHSECIDSFIKFLQGLKVRENILNYLLLYHYGDDTLDGSGIKRYSAEECKLKYRDNIMIFNKYVSYNNILTKIIDRFLFLGTKNNKYAVDAIYYGNEHYGIWASREEILNYLINNKCFYMKSIHFSSLTFQNLGRNINKNKKSEFHRKYIQIKWFSIVSDMQKIKRNKFNI